MKSNRFQMFCDINVCVWFIHYFNIVSPAVTDFLYQDFYVYMLRITADRQLTS
jgi:hypothetical protein